MNSENQPVSYTEAITSSIITISHPSSHRYEQFHGIAASILPDGDPENPLFLIYEPTPTGRGDKVFCISLSYLTSGDPVNPMTVKSLSDLTASSDSSSPEWIKWSTTLQLSQVHLGVIPSTAIAGALVLTSASSSTDRMRNIGILSPFGEYFVLNSINGEMQRNHVITNEIICSCGYIESEKKDGGDVATGPVMYLLTGHDGKLIRYEI